MSAPITLLVDAQGHCPPAILSRSGATYNAVEWESSSKHDITGLPKGIFTRNPPDPLHISSQRASGYFTVKPDAPLGTYYYSISPSTPNGQPKIIIQP